MIDIVLSIRLSARIVRGDDRLVLMFTALLHDVGKKATTVFDRGRWRSPGHAEAGVDLAQEFLIGIGCPQRLISRILPLIREHMYPTWEKQTARMIRRLMVRLEPATLQELLYVIEADHSGRPPLPKSKGEGVEEIMKIQVDLPSKIAPILQGRHLLDAGLYDPGPEMGRILKEAFQAQLDGDFDDLNGAMKWISER